MSHYGIGQWVDFARDLAPEPDSVSMRNHLAEGCPDCREVEEFFQKLGSVCRNMAGSEAPERVVRYAHAIFPMRQPARPKRSLRIPIQLIYDSLLVPAPAGLRASWQVGWQALYRAGDCSLDLRIEPELQSSRAAVIGQISNHLLPEIEMGNIPVYLKSGKFVVSETLSNRFGEFQMEYEQRGRLQLCVYLDNGSKYVQVPLKKFAAERPVGGDRLNLGPVAGRKKKTRPDTQ
jgi:hypothetical protein